MLRAAVPEASVDEDCELQATPGDVCSGAEVRLELDVRTESQAASVENLPNGDLWRGVSGSLPAHSGAYGVG